MKEGTVHLSKATAARNMKEIETANTLIERANDKLSAIKRHQEKITTAMGVLGKRRKALLGTDIHSKKKVI